MTKSNRISPNKSFFFKAVLFFITTLTVQMAQSQGSEIPVIAYWEKGNEFEFEVTKRKLQLKEGVETKNSTVSYLAKFKVLEETDESYTIEWRMTTPAGTAVENSDFMPAVMDKVIYKTDENGAFMEIMDWQKIADDIREVTDELLKKANNGVPDAQLENLNESKSALLSKEGIEQIYFKELQLLHFPFGAAFDIIDTLVYDEQLPNFLGGDPINAKGKVYIESITSDSIHCVIKQELRIPNDEVMKLMESIFTKMKIPEEDLPDAKSKWIYDFKDLNRYELDYIVGIPIHFKTSRTILIDIAGEKAERVDEMEIRRIK